jgi:hypothetical protein
MFHLISESGIGGWIVLLFTIVGLAVVLTVGRRSGRPGSMAAIWAAAILAAGAIGYGTGQHATDRGLRNPDIDPQRRAALLARGSAESASNFILAGNGALLVLLAGGLLSAFRRKEASASRVGGEGHAHHPAAAVAK